MTMAMESLRSILSTRSKPSWPRLKGTIDLEHPIAKNPVLMKGGFLYRLDKKGEVEKIKHEQADPLDFSLSHNDRCRDRM